ncbi:DUF3578 domain-containing protein [Paracoccus marcusii]|uniref:DUF3578 domain-containing protein n=1 Tax=Paracoccus marcusii TaxID=59779 RepID=A0ABY7UWE2_9RHOB|nr:DUF3578 domain-containing protein [Paracoccus marcusii]WDA13108.1 DUF3578 domain-containing protein [Paracoccus marcusii]
MAGHPLAGFFRRDVAALARAAVARRPERLLVRASTGAPGWAAVPWVAWFAPHVTRSMRHGLYVACFVNAPDERIVLSLQHGAADALREHGHDAGLRHLRDRAARTRDGLPGHGFDTRPIALGSDATLPQGYQAGCVLSRSWDAAAPDPEGFDRALIRMLDLYRALV